MTTPPWCSEKVLVYYYYYYTVQQHITLQHVDFFHPLMFLVHMQLPLTELRDQLQQEQQALADMCPEAVAAPLETDKPPSAHQLWQEKLEALVAAVREVVIEGDGLVTFSLGF